MIGKPIPSEWINCVIEEICQLNPKSSLDDALEVGFMPMAGAPTDYFGSCEFETRTWAAVKKGFTQFKNGDAIFAKITPCFENSKAAVIRNFPNSWGAGSTEYYVLRPYGELVLPELLFALTKTKEFLVEGAVNMTGSVGHKRVPKDFVLSYQFPLPPLAEQKVIADKLDTLLAQVESTKARLDRIPQILKRFRQSVLAAAVSGRLTEEWRGERSLKNTDLSKFEECVESSFYGPRFSKNDYTTDSDGVPTVRTTDMKNGKISISADTPRVHVPEDKLELFKAIKGDLLITRTGSIGVIALVKDDILSIPSAYLIRFRLNSSIVPEFAYYSLTSPQCQQQMGLHTTAITQPNINAKSIRNIELRVPAIEEQTEIVRRVDQLFAYADNIEQQVASAQQRVDKLTQSVLAKAFRGELTEQWRKDNPDLITGDNSAEALLAKIKAERDAMKPMKKTRKKKAKN